MINTNRAQKGPKKVVNNLGKDIPLEYKINGVVPTYINLSNNSIIRPLVCNTVTDLMGLPLFPAEDLIETKDRTLDVMSKILASDCVILFYTQDIKSITPPGCEECCIKETMCNNTYKCKSFIEFEIRFAISMKKRVLVFIDKKAINEKNNVLNREDGFLKMISKNQSGIKSVCYKELKGTDIMPSFISIRDELFSMGIGFFRPKDYCLIVQNKCVQRKSVPQKTIGEYTITSGEMSADSKSEIHILTNEWKNYDYTTLSALTIAINTKKGVKYCYYAPQKYKNEVETFKELLKDYYFKTFKARDKVVAWIRMSKCEHYYLDDFLSTITNKPIKEVLSSLLFSSDNYELEILERLLGVCLENGSVISLNVDRGKLNDWIHGKIINNDRTLLRFLRNIGVVLTAINSEKDLRKNSTIDAFCKKLELLYNMYRLLQWQTDRDEEKQRIFSDDEIAEIINYFKYRDNDVLGDASNLIISDHFEEWLRDSGGREIIGVLPDDETNNVNKYLDNIIFLPICEKMPIELAYSFSLFLGYNPFGGTYNESAAWYTTSSDNEDTSEDKIDNGLFMVDIGPRDELFGDIKEIFRKIISYNHNIKEILKQNKSAILGLKGFDI